MESANKNTSKSNNKSPHPYALFGDKNRDGFLGVMMIPDHANKKVNEPIQPTIFELSNSPLTAIPDAISISSLIDHSKKVKKLGLKRPERSHFETVIPDCIGLAQIIQQEEKVSGKEVKEGLPVYSDKNIMLDCVVFPLLFPASSTNVRSSELSSVFAKEERKMESSLIPTNDHQKGQDRFSPKSSKIKDQKETSPTDPQSNIETESDFLAWIREKNQQPISDTEINDAQKDDKEKSGKTKDSASLKKEKTKAKKKKKKAKKKAKKKKKKLKKLLESSNEIGDQIVSETLAKLLAHQGHKERAIDMYEKLSLLNPKKSSYFAEIIKNLEEK